MIDGIVVTKHTVILFQHININRLKYSFWYNSIHSICYFCELLLVLVKQNYTLYLIVVLGIEVWSSYNAPWICIGIWWLCNAGNLTKHTRLQNNTITIYLKVSYVVMIQSYLFIYLIFKYKNMLVNSIITNSICDVNLKLIEKSDWAVNLYIDQHNKQYTNYCI